MPHDLFNDPNAVETVPSHTGQSADQVSSLGRSVQHDNGVGEQDDVLAALSFLTGSGFQPVDLAGYSFGAWVNAHALQKDTLTKQMIMVSPPVGFMDFKSIVTMNTLKFVVTGNRDDIAPANVIEKMISTWNPNARFEVIDGADHFYGGYLGQLEACLSSI